MVSAKERLRKTFDDVAERYDAARPGYPDAMVADLARMTGLGAGSRVLEIGCGTGQLTIPLARLGAAVTAVELGSALADVARRKLTAHPDSQVVVGAFEDVTLTEGSFDLVVAATSFHWIDEAVRVKKSAQALSVGGALTVIDTHHVAGGTEHFFRDVQGCYEAWDRSTPTGLRLPKEDDVPTAKPELDQSPLFGPVVLRRYRWEATYTTAEYRALLLTYSGHLALPEDKREGLLACISGLIDERFSGKVTKSYLTELRVARRRLASY